MIDLRLGLGLLLAVSAASCADAPAITVRYAPEFSPGKTTVAVLGVFQGGRLSATSWYPLAPRISPALGRPVCPAGFGEALQKVDADLYASLDEDVAENGITDEMLERVAPKTDAEVILTLSMHGQVQHAKAPATGEEPTMQGHRPGAGGGMRGHRGGGRPRSVDLAGLEITGSLFSRKLHRSVGRISLRYTGASVEEAVKQFADKLGQELAGSTCRDWSWQKQAGPPSGPTPSAPPPSERGDGAASDP